MEEHPTIRNLVRESPEHPWKYITVDGKGSTCAVKGCRKPRDASSRTITCSRCCKARIRANDPLRYIYSNIRDRARKKRQAFNWSFEEFKVFAKESGYDEKCGRYLGCLHVDRINPLEGYHPGNVRALEAGENSSKGAGEDKKAHWLAARRGRGDTIYEQPALVPEEEDPDYVGF